VQWDIWYELGDTSSLKVVGFCNHTAENKDVLLDYATMQGINFPLIFDQESSIFYLYHIGVKYGTKIPNFFVIDKKGIIRYRYDNTYGKVTIIKNF